MSATVVPVLSEPTLSVGSTSSSDEPTLRPDRPRLGSRKSSGTMIVPRESASVEQEGADEVYDADDVRSMSPKRSHEDIQRLGEDARNALME